jgi:hypothetical protein
MICSAIEQLGFGTFHCGIKMDTDSGVLRPVILATWEDQLIKDGHWVGVWLK